MVVVDSFLAMVRATRRGTERERERDGSALTSLYDREKKYSSNRKAGGLSLRLRHRGRENGPYRLENQLGLIHCLLDVSFVDIFAFRLSKQQRQQTDTTMSAVLFIIL
jgi:hypothetical protein